MVWERGGQWIHNFASMITLNKHAAWPMHCGIIGPTCACFLYSWTFSPTLQPSSVTATSALALSFSYIKPHVTVISSLRLILILTWVRHLLTASQLYLYLYHHHSSRLISFQSLASIPNRTGPVSPELPVRILWACATTKSPLTPVFKVSSPIIDILEDSTAYCLISLVICTFVPSLGVFVSWPSSSALWRYSINDIIANNVAFAG